MDYKIMPPESGVYIIKNLVNNRVYIGQAKDVRRRIREHLNSANKGVKHHLYHSIRKYGVDKFTVNVLEVCDVDLLDERENFWIGLYQATNHGYNICLEAKTFRGIKHTVKQLLARTGKYAPSPITLYDSEKESVQAFISFNSLCTHMGIIRASATQLKKNGRVLLKKRYLAIKGKKSLSQAKKEYQNYLADYIESRRSAGRTKKK